VENVAFQSLYTFVLHAEIATTFGPKMGALWKPGISRNMAEYAGISRNMPEYYGIWRNITEYNDVFPEYTWTTRYFSMVAMRLFINIDVWQHILITKAMDLSHFDGK
jgi:hypothetical protein